jgi:hypothetical protein
MDMHESLKNDMESMKSSVQTQAVALEKLESKMGWHT